MCAQNRTRTSSRVVILCLLLGVRVHGGAAPAVSVHSSGRYFQDAAGNPKFLIGYYGWAAVPDGCYIDHPSRYSQMITQGAPYKINYIRISLGVNRMTSVTDPPSWNGAPTPVPFLYVNGKADLNQWDSVFWNGLKAQCQLARDNGVIVHVSIFDGVELRHQGGASYGYQNSFWKPGNQTTAFYSDPDLNANGQIDDSGEFYQLANFDNNSGIGYYQRRLIDKTTAELAGYDNVFYEVGNELLSSDSNWNSAVIGYIRSKTSSPVSQCGGSRATNLQGWSQHSADTPAQVRANVAAIVGMGYPAWEDCDGPALSNSDVSPDDLRRAAWYSFAGGSPCWGGFTVDYWAGGRGFWAPTVTYYRNLQAFIEASGVGFWEMTPQHSLVGNNAENSCLAKSGLEYLGYVLNDSSVTLNLSGATGTAYYRTYDPKTGVLSVQQTVTAGGVVTFNKPAGADDWVVHVTATPSLDWDSLGSQQTVASGQMPAVATDSLGNIHVIYLSGSAVQYRKFDASMNLLASETVTGSAAYWPHIMCDSSNVPHVVYTESVDPGMPYARYCYYTNRSNGSWKTAVMAIDAGSGNGLWYPRLSLWSGYAYIGVQCGLSSELIGKIVRLANLSGTPSVDRSVYTQTRSCIAVTGSGQVFAPGRYGPAGTYCQEYDSDLNAVGGFYNVSAGPGKTGGSQTAWADQSNVVHMITWAIEANGAFPCNDRCGMAYNNTGRRNPDGSYFNCIQGLLGGAAGTGPDGNEPSGWWNDDVAPVIVADALNTIYVAWRGWTAAGEGRISRVDNSGFTQTCSPDPACGNNTCTGTQFCSNITRRRWWNCEMAPARDRGVYVVWENAGTVHLRSVGVSGCTTPAPDPVTGFTAVAGPNQVYLSWTNPAGGNFAGVKIVGKTTGYPANPSDGSVVCSGTGTSCVHSGLSGATTYYYAAFSYNECPSYSTAATASATTTSPYCFNDEFSYPDGNLNGNGGWSGSAGAQIRIANETLAIEGGATSYDAVKTVSCSDPGTGYIKVTVKVRSGIGEMTMWSLWLDDSSGKNLARWYGAGTTARGRIGDSGIVTGTQTLTGTWDSLVVKIYATTNTSEFLFNGASIGTLDHTGTGAGDTLGRLRFERIDNGNAAGHYLHFDDLSVGEHRIPGDFNGDQDVDQEDFGHLQECLSGDGLSFGPGCQDADLDPDGDVDQVDVSRFIECMNGPGQASPCAE